MAPRKKKAAGKAKQKQEDAGPPAAVPWNSPSAALTADEPQVVVDALARAVEALEPNFFAKGTFRLPHGEKFEMRYLSSSSANTNTDGQKGKKRTTSALQEQQQQQGQDEENLPLPEKDQEQERSESRPAKAAKGSKADSSKTNANAVADNADDSAAATLALSLPARLCEPRAAASGGASANRGPPLKPERQFEDLLRAAAPSGFGHGDQTRFDEAVRRASEIPADRILSLSLDIEASGILEEVRAALAPDTPKISATLHKLNVYGKDGFFAKHRDTPLDEQQFGTLVVCLPAAHWGGSLHLKQGNKEVELDWAESLSSGTPDYPSYLSDWSRDRALACVPNGKLPWVAFYGDCEHWIDRVTDGKRLTLTYVLRREENDLGAAVAAAALPAAAEQAQTPEQAAIQQLSDRQNKSKAGSSASAAGSAAAATPQLNAEVLSKKKIPELKELCRAAGLPVSGSKGVLVERLAPAPTLDDPAALQRITDLYKRFTEALLNPNFGPSGVVLVFPCAHLYETAKELPSASAKTAAKLSLKGTDAAVYVTATTLGLNPDVLRCVSLLDNDSCWRVLPTSDDNKDIRAYVKERIASEEIIEDQFPGWGINLEEDDSWHDSLEDAISSRFNEEDTFFVFDPPDKRSVQRGEGRAALGPVVEEIWTTGTGYFGNEASQETMYSNAVIALRIPALTDTAREHVRELASSLASPEQWSTVLSAYNGLKAGAGGVRDEYSSANARSRKLPLSRSMQQEAREIKAERWGGGWGDSDEDSDDDMFGGGDVLMSILMSQMMGRR